MTAYLVWRRDNGVDAIRESVIHRPYDQVVWGGDRRALRTATSTLFPNFDIVSDQFLRISQLYMLLHMPPPHAPCDVHPPTWYPRLLGARLRPGQLRLWDNQGRRPDSGADRQARLKGVVLRVATV